MAENTKQKKNKKQKEEYISTELTTSIKEITEGLKADNKKDKENTKLEPSENGTTEGIFIEDGKKYKYYSKYRTDKKGIKKEYKFKMQLAEGNKQRGRKCNEYKSLLRKILPELTEEICKKIIETIGEFTKNYEVETVENAETVEQTK